MIHATRMSIPYQTQFTNGTHTSLADVPRDKGGLGIGFGPHELIEAALATCMTITVTRFAEKHHLSLTNVECEVHADRTLPDLVAFRYALRCQGELSPEQHLQLQEAASQCPVARTLTGNMVFKSLDEGV